MLKRSFQLQNHYKQSRVCCLAERNNNKHPAKSDQWYPRERKRSPALPSSTSFPPEIPPKSKLLTNEGCFGTVCRFTLNLRLWISEWSKKKILKPRSKTRPIHGRFSSKRLHENTKSFTQDEQTQWFARSDVKTMIFLARNNGIFSAEKTFIQNRF